MKKFMLGLLAIGAIAPVAFAGTETYSGKEMKQVAPPPCPEWYADREFNISVWGTYVFTGNDSRDDRYIDGDHAWGGGRDNDGDPVTFPNSGNEHRAVGAVLGTLTLRYPFHCSRFSPYVFGGGGVIFGGGERRSFDESDLDLPNDDTNTEGIGQFGGGFEIRITPHIGWINDFSWNVINGPENNFGMVRSGINFAF